MNDYTIVISSIVVVVGWLVNNWFTRRHDVAKKRLEYRLETLHSFLPVFLSMTSSSAPFIDDKSLNDKIIQARVNFQLYGNINEINIFEEFVKAIEKQDTLEATNTINKLIGMVRRGIRAELKLSEYPIQKDSAQSLKE